MNLYQEMGRFVAIPEGFLCDDISLLSKMIYTTVMAFTDKDFRAFPSMETIAKILRTSKPTVIKGVEELEKSGWISVKRNVGGRNIYQLKTAQKGKKSYQISDFTSQDSLLGSKNSLQVTSQDSLLGSKNSLPVPVKNLYPNKIRKNKKLEGLTSSSLEVIERLKDLSGRSRLKPTKNTIAPIIARLKEKYSKEDLLHVVEVKCEEWKDDTSMKQYLHPATLFRPSNIDKYLAQEKRNAVGKIEKCSCGGLDFIGTGERRRCMACQKLSAS